MSGPLKCFGEPQMGCRGLIVGWTLDASRLGGRVVNYLNKKLGGEAFCEIEPVDFFPLNGVVVEASLVQFPESNFYAAPKSGLVLFKSTPPAYEWYKFLNLVLDAADTYCHAKELYIIGGMISMNAYNVSRELRGTFNSAELKAACATYGLSEGVDYETPAGQRPTPNSFLLWGARRRDKPAVSLWASVPFYLTSLNDPASEKKLIEFFNQRFSLGLDLSDLDEEVRVQDEKLAQLRQIHPDVDMSFKKLEDHQTLSDEESQGLVREVEKALK